MKKVILSMGVLGLAVIGLATTKAEAAEVVENGVRYHQVEANDTLSEISAKYGFNVNDFQAANADKIDNIHQIFVGDLLAIPGEATTVVGQAPVQTQEAVTVQEQPAVVETPVQEAVPVQEQAAPVETTTVAPAGGSAKEWIAQKESGGSYSATNGQYVGRYQLSASYLNGDYSAANQERVADQYVAGRYGSWEGAQAFWMQNGWY